MTDDQMDRIRVTMNVIGSAINECSRAVRYVEEAWNDEEYDLFTSAKATEAVFEFTEALPFIKGKAEAAYNELADCYTK